MGTRGEGRQAGRGRAMAPVGQFPLFRLAALLARQLSTPVAAKIKVYARTHPRFGRAVCMRTGRAYHACELRFKMWSLALRQPRVVPPISDKVALDCGANILGEMAVFGLGGLIIIFEVNRQANKQEDKELDEASRWLALLVSLEELQRELTQQQQDIDRLQDTLRRLAPKHRPRSHLAPASASTSAIFLSSFSSQDASSSAKASSAAEASTSAESSSSGDGASSAELLSSAEACSLSSSSAMSGASMSVPVSACPASPTSSAEPLSPSMIKSPSPPPPMERF